MLKGISNQYKFFFYVFTNWEKYPSSDRRNIEKCLVFQGGGSATYSGGGGFSPPHGSVKSMVFGFFFGPHGCWAHPRKIFLTRPQRRIKLSCLFENRKCWGYSKQRNSLGNKSNILIDAWNMINLLIEIIEIISNMLIADSLN